jgi:hypothetical protein
MDDAQDAVISDIEIPYPLMKGNARMALGAGYFEVPLFTPLTRFLWTGCSPAEFPNEMEEFDYDPMKVYFSGPFKEPIECKWLWQSKSSSEAAAENDWEEPPPFFDSILNLYPWGKYVVPEGVEYREVELYDSADEPDVEQIEELAAWVISRRGEGQTGRVLVHCQAGLNRSALVAARALMVAKGMTADDAIGLIREKRSPTCLCNPTFERFLRKFDAKS